jgi:hypothetical protein
VWLLASYGRPLCPPHGRGRCPATGALSLADGQVAARWKDPRLRGARATLVKTDPSESCAQLLHRALMAVEFLHRPCASTVRWSPLHCAPGHSHRLARPRPQHDSIVQEVHRDANIAIVDDMRACECHQSMASPPLSSLATVAVFDFSLARSARSSTAAGTRGVRFFMEYDRRHQHRRFRRRHRRCRSRDVNRRPATRRSGLRIRFSRENDRDRDDDRSIRTVDLSVAGCIRAVGDENFTAATLSVRGAVSAFWFTTQRDRLDRLGSAAPYDAHRRNSKFIVHRHPHDWWPATRGR